MSWKNKLDQQDAMPPGAWEKLEARLAVKNPGNNKLWWSLAAACLIGVVFVVSNYVQPAKTISVISTDIYTPQKSTLFLPPDVVRISPTIETKKVFKKGISKKHAPVPPLAVKEIIVPPVVTNDTVAIAKVEMPAVPAKAKLRVVHINELQPNDDRQKRELLIRSYVTNSSSDQILKIELTPSN